MRVLLISSSFPYPIDIGRKVIISGFLEYFLCAFGAANVIFAYVASGAEVPRRGELGCEVVALPLDGIARRLIGVTWESLVRRRHAVQEMMVYSQTAAVRLKTLLYGTAPDLVVVDTVRMAQYLEAETRRSARTFVYLDDLYSLRYRRMLLAMRAYPDVPFDSIGSFGRFMPGYVRRVAAAPTLQRSLLRLESRLLEEREQEMPLHFDRALLLNAEEAAHLAKQTGATNIYTVKPLLRSHRRRLSRRFTGEPTYVFLGNLQYPANAYSLSLFMRKAMPTLMRAQPRTKLIVIGRGANEDLIEQGKASDGRVEFLDFVDDLAPLMSTAAAMVVPLVYGSGLKMKVLDALYYGLPVVSTPQGIDGVPVTPGRECFVKDDIESFAQPLTELLDPGRNRWMSDCAQDLYAAQFAPDIVWAEYQGIFGMTEVPRALPQPQTYAQ